VKSSSAWAKLIARNLSTLTRGSLRSGARPMQAALTSVLAKRKPPIGTGDWLAGVAMGATGACQFRLFRPPGVKFGERLPLMVMLHGCHQDAKSFAASTRMNVVAARERFLVLYPQQDRLSNAQGCWNWFDTKSGRAYSEAALIMRAINQVCMLYSADRERVGIAGLSAGASMAALLVTRYPDRFNALTMHSGIPPGTANSSLSAVGAMYGHRSTKPLPASPGRFESSWPPLLVIHGDADPVVASTNGRAAVHIWATAAGAAPVSGRDVQRGHRHPMRVTDFKRRGTTMVTLVEVERLAHAWSGGAANQHFSDNKGPDASRMAWAFTAKQFGRLT
jgi:poly(hydroxyalkanoate) depolymerase family esterase